MMHSWYPILTCEEGDRRRGRQRMSWVDSITDPRDMNISKLQETVKDRGAGLQSTGSQRD